LSLLLTVLEKVRAAVG